jgi:hypothetical protein
MGMTIAKKNMLLLACLLMIVWLVTGAFVHVGQPADKQKPSTEPGAATSSMSADGIDFDLVEAASVMHISQASQEPFRFQYSKSGTLVPAVYATLLAVVIICLKLFQAVNLPFNFNRIPVYIHDQDGMK